MLDLQRLGYEKEHDADTEEAHRGDQCARRREPGRADRGTREERRAGHAGISEHAPYT